MSVQQPRWKRRLLRTPQIILDKVAKLVHDTCVVASSIKIPKQAIHDGVYKHIHLIWKNDTAAFPDKVIPDRNNGPYSRWNIDGKVLVLEDEPMIFKTITINTPNFGDWSKGSHDVSFERKVYQREYIPPKELAIKIELVAEDVREQSYVFSFIVDEVLDRTASNFEQQLFFNLNRFSWTSRSSS